MTLTMDDHNRSRHGALGSYHHSMPPYNNPPPFTNPWASSSSATGHGHQGGTQQHSLYGGSHESGGLPHLNLGSLSRQQPSPQHAQHQAHTGAIASSTSMAPYGSLPVTASPAGNPSLGGVYKQHDLLSISQDPFSLNRLQQPTTSAAYDTSGYTATASPVNATYATTTTSSSPYEHIGYAPAQMRGAFALGHDDSARRYSQQGLQPDDRRSFQDALEASHGMLSMSQDTPRNIYDVRSRERGSADSYGFPSTHSSTSSVSSTGFSGYYGGSIDGSVGSVSDYSATGSDIEGLSGRTLPRPQGLMPNQPPAPQSMMGSFSSRVSSSAQKKHKCKVCDKRFTRPSSLQTHMYSHTGEKPYACEEDGCGRRFSVVSNLRRHKKVHKRGGQTPSDTGSEAHESP
ncbi:hypothetical protein VTI74DRAFT_9337 [Chaetomium olivicolor]